MIKHDEIYRNANDSCTYKLVSFVMFVIILSVYVDSY